MSTYTFGINTFTLRMASINDCLAVQTVRSLCKRHTSNCSSRQDVLAHVAPYRQNFRRLHVRPRQLTNWGAASFNCPSATEVFSKCRRILSCRNRRSRPLRLPARASASSNWISVKVSRTRSRQNSPISCESFAILLELSLLR